MEDSEGPGVTVGPFYLLTISEAVLMGVTIWRVVYSISALVEASLKG